MVIDVLKLKYSIVTASMPIQIFLKLNFAPSSLLWFLVLNLSIRSSAEIQSCLIFEWCLYSTCIFLKSNIPSSCETRSCRLYECRDRRDKSKHNPPSSIYAVHFYYSTRVFSFTYTLFSVSWVCFRSFIYFFLNNCTQDNKAEQIVPKSFNAL